MHNVFHGVKYQLEIQRFSAINFASSENHFFLGGWGWGLWAGRVKVNNVNNFHERSYW